MTSTDKQRLLTALVALGAVLALCATTATDFFAATAQAERRPQGSEAAGAPDDTAWSNPQNVSDSWGVDSRAPALAVTDSGIAHIVWEEGDGLYHSYRGHGFWSEPSPIPGTGTGEQPALCAGPNDGVHLVYVNGIDIFYAAWGASGWSLPKNVSQTSQISGSPDLAVASDGSIHIVAPEQTTSGKQLYYANSDDGAVWPVYVPVPNAYGEGPSIDVADEDTIHIAYRDDDQDDTYTLRRTNSTWNLPENVSRTPDAFSTAPDLAVDETGTPEVAWQESVSDTNQIRYSRGEGWIPVVTLSSGSGAYLPSLALDTFGRRHVAWDDEGFPFAIRHTWTRDPGIWPAPEPVYAGSLSLEDVTLYAGRDGVLHAAWTEIESGNGEILYATRPPDRVFLPLIVRGQ
jgi:hypothetical protein